MLRRREKETPGDRDECDPAAAGRRRRHAGGPDKELTDRAVAAVGRVDEAGILFAITSGRPPRGMSMLIEPLNLTTPIAAFNGGLLVNRDMSVVEQRVLPAEP
jgi:hydroxymethylpyrimidine pyrophosphatase-like HAD family hydrolase